MTVHVWGDADESHPGFIEFKSEDEAEEYVATELAPFCSVLKRQPKFKCGLRPDIGARLRVLPDIPLAIEVKAFSNGNFSNFVDAVAQASTYAKELGTAAFVAPVRGRGMMHLSWYDSPVGAGLLLAGEFNVGGIAFCRKRGSAHSIGCMLLGGQAVVTFTYNEWGAPAPRVLHNAAHMLRFKHRVGSQTERMRGAG